MLHTVSNGPAFFSLEGIRVTSTFLIGTLQERGTLEKIALLVSTMLGAVVGYTIAAMILSAALVPLPTAAIFAFGIVAGAAFFAIVTALALYSLRSRRAENVPPAVPLSDFARAARDPVNLQAVATILAAMERRSAARRSAARRMHSRITQEAIDSDLIEIIARPDIAAIINQSGRAFSEELRRALSSGTSPSAVLQAFPAINPHLRWFAIGLLSPMQGLPFSAVSMHSAPLRHALDAGKSFREILASLRAHPEGRRAMGYLLPARYFGEEPPAEFESTVREWVPRNPQSIIDLAVAVKNSPDAAAFDTIRQAYADQSNSIFVPVQAEAAVRERPWLRKGIAAAETIIATGTDPHTPILTAAFAEDPAAALAVIKWIPVLFQTSRRE